MPQYTTNYNIPYPVGGDPIRGNSIDNLRTDLEALARGADSAADTAKSEAIQESIQRDNALSDDLADVQKVQFTHGAHIEAVESLAAEPGSRVVNVVADPLPVNPTVTYGGGHVTLTEAPAWGRAIYNGTGGATVAPRLWDGQGMAVTTPASPGQDVAFTVRLRANPTQRLSATVYMVYYVQGVAQASFLSTGQFDLDPDERRIFSAQGVVPEGADAVRLIITFRRYGETYPSQGDFIYWQNLGVYLGAVPVPLEVASGDDDYSYWLGDPHQSGAVSMKPREMSGGEEEFVANAALTRMALLDDFTHRRGGVKRVPGKTVISFRIDHGLANFAAKMLPKLEEHDFPYALALNSRSWGNSENAGITPSIVNGWVESGLAEIWNHGPSHADTSDHGTIYDYIINTKAELEADIPACAPIDGYMPPGASGAGGYDGFIPTSSPEKFYGTYAGQLAMGTYPAISGQLAIYRIQDGRPRIGQGYLRMDTYQAYQVIQRVQNAINDGHGVQLMIHPSLIDEPGYITTADLHEVIDQVKAFQDAGDVVVMSAYDQLLADATQP